MPFRESLACVFVAAKAFVGAANFFTILAPRAYESYLIPSISSYVFIVSGEV
jgi:hypothetical protein